MSIARKMMMLVLIVALSAPVMGCAGVGKAPADHRHEIARVVDYDTRMFVDDVLLLTQLRRPLRTSRWIID